MYVVSTCSAHCRFCYREELIARKEISARTAPSPRRASRKIPEIVDYIRQHNAKVEANGGRHPETGREKLREILLSGGDPMVLNNSKLAAWFAALAEAGIESIRIGTKEMAFYPQRFDDDTFLDMLDGSTRPTPTWASTSCSTSSTPTSSSPRTTTASTSGVTTAHSVDPRDRRGDARARLAGLDHRREPGAHHQGHQRRRRRAPHHAARVQARRAARTTTSSAAATSSPTRRSTSRSRRPGRSSTTRRRGSRASRSTRGFRSPTTRARPRSRGHQRADPGPPWLRERRRDLQAPAQRRDAPDRGKVCIVGRNPDAMWFDDYEDRVLFDEGRAVRLLMRRERPDRQPALSTGEIRAGCPECEADDQQAVGLERSGGSRGRLRRRDVS